MEASKKRKSEEMETQFVGFDPPQKNPIIKEKGSSVTLEDAINLLEHFSHGQISETAGFGLSRKVKDDRLGRADRIRAGWEQLIEVERKQKYMTVGMMRENLLNPNKSGKPKDRFFAKWKEYGENEVEILRKRDLGCAEAGLEHYNRLHGTHYQLVEPLQAYFILHGSFWYHTNFTAKCTDTNEGPTLFFAELLRRDKGYDVKTCKIIGSQAIQGCVICPKHVAHPLGGFKFASQSEVL